MAGVRVEMHVDAWWNVADLLNRVFVESALMTAPFRSVSVPPSTCTAMTSRSVSRSVP